MSPPSPPRASVEQQQSTAAGLLTEPIQPSHPLADFRSGEHALDDFLKRHALNNEGAVSRTFVLLRTPDLPSTAPVLVGFYSLSMLQVESKDAAPHLLARLPRYPLGAVLLGRLAVDERVRGRKLGSVLIFDALRRARLAALQAGSAGVLVDAKNDTALNWYLKYGFKELSPGEVWPQRLFLSFHGIESLLAR